MTHHVTSMLDTYPKDLGGVDKEKLAECIEACFECAQTCTACADACLSEDVVAELTKCIRTDLDCADICTCRFSPDVCEVRNYPGPQSGADVDVVNVDGPFA